MSLRTKTEILQTLEALDIVKGQERYLMYSFILFLYNKMIKAGKDIKLIILKEIDCSSYIYISVLTKQ